MSEKGPGHLDWSSSGKETADAAGLTLGVEESAVKALRELDWESWSHANVWSKSLRHPKGRTLRLSIVQGTIESRFVELVKGQYLVVAREQDGSWERSAKDLPSAKISARVYAKAWWMKQDLGLPQADNVEGHVGCPRVIDGHCMCGHML